MACSPVAAYFPLGMQRAAEADAGVGLVIRRCVAWTVWERDSGDRHPECKKKKKKVAKYLQDICGVCAGCWLHQ